ncbi:MAG: hypothetical protein R3C70_15780 [Geminicoccaceae bacterium]
MALTRAIRQWLCGGMTRVPPPRATRPRDFQRSRVYGWERRFVMPLACDPMGLDACRALVLDVYLLCEADRCEERGWKPPEVTDGRGRRHACGSRAVIKLPRWARTKAVVLHECAHGLAADAHGPEFVRVYIGLLETFAGFERVYLERTLNEAKVRVAPVFTQGNAPSRTIAARPASRIPATEQQRKSAFTRH